MFSVFGTSWAKAEAKAIKQTSAVDDDGGPLSLREYSERLRANTERIFEKMKPCKISPIYSRRDLAAKYLELAAESGGTEGAKIMRVTGIEKSAKTGRAKIVWGEV